MKALIQRVSEARVTVDDEVVGEIGQGLLVLLGVERGDDEALTEKMADRLLAYRVFADAAGKMNLSVRDIAGGVLVVSQFTLAADTRKGLRPGFSGAADPQTAERLYHHMVNTLAGNLATVGAGRFAANMQVALVNDGPVTFMLEMSAQ